MKWWLNRPNKFDIHIIDEKINKLEFSVCSEAWEQLSIEILIIVYMNLIKANTKNNWYY